MPTDVTNALPQWTEGDSQILFPLTISRSTFEFLSKFLKLPKSYLSTLERRTPVYETFVPEEDSTHFGPGEPYERSNLYEH